MIVRRWVEIETEATPEKWAEARAASKRAREAMTPEEDATITADAMSDPDSLPMTDAEFAAARRVPLSEALPFFDDVLPLDADVLIRLRAEGPDWRVRANAILRAALEAA